MANYHVHLSYVGKGQARGGASGFHRYLERDGLDAGSQFHRYLERENGHGKDDLVAHGHANLPAWSEGTPARFWELADTLERKNGPVYWHLQVALPRELSPDGRLALAHDIRETMVGRYPHSWELHEPQSRDKSGIQPHIHIQFSSRREDIERGLSAEQWFKQPNHGGVGKDKSWFTKERLLDVREGVALLTNAALSREGLHLAVDHRTLEAQGLSRDPARYRDRTDQGMVLAYREQLSATGVRAFEQLQRYAGWRDQACQLLSLDSTYVRDLVRDHVWQRDRSPARILEREMSMQRTLDLAMDHRRTLTPERTWTQERTRSQHWERTPVHDLGRSLGGLAAALTHDETPVGSGLKARVFDREQERERESYDRGLGLGF